MRVFVTGATGFIGSAIVQEFIGAGHRVLGLARSDASAASLVAAGADVHRGALDDFESLQRGATDADAVVHTAFIHDFENVRGAAATDVRAIEVLGEACAGSGRSLVVTSGTALIAPGRVATEEDEPDPALTATWPRKSEETAIAMVAQGVRASVVRLPPSVHGDGDHGFVPRLIDIAREKGVSAYVGNGLNRWPAVHRLDAAYLFRLATEKNFAGARYHGVADEGVSFRAIAEVIGRHLNIPVISKSKEEASEHFGFLGLFATMDIPASSMATRLRLGWRPVQPGLLADLDREHYFQRAVVSI